MEMFRECGFVAFVVLAAALLALVAAIVALCVAALTRRFGVAVAVMALALALVVPALGAVGTLWGRNVTDSAISGESIDPAQRERIRQAGYQEAAQCTSLGAMTGALPVLLSVVACVIAVVRRRPREVADS
jgi:hypothetical protein